MLYAIRDNNSTYPDSSIKQKRNKKSFIMKVFVFISITTCMAIGSINALKNDIVVSNEVESLFPKIKDNQQRKLPASPDCCILKCPPPPKDQAKGGSKREGRGGSRSKGKGDNRQLRTHGDGHYDDCMWDCSGCSKPLEPDHCDCDCDIDKPSLGVASGSPPITEGKCLLNVDLQREGTIPNGIPTDWHPDNNVIVTLPDPASCEVGVSPTWTASNWNFTVVYLAPNSAFMPPPPASHERQLVKILKGTLLDINVNGLLRSDDHWETYSVTAPNRPTSLFIDNSIDVIMSGSDGAVFVYMKVTEDALNTPMTDMETAPATVVGGPYSENFKWNNYGNVYPIFDDVEFYNMAGILINDYNDKRFCYLQWWTFREDQNADGYHDQSNLNTTNAFAELHMAMYAATGVSGMQTTLPATENLNWIQNPNPIPSNEEHAYNNNNATGVQIAVVMPPGHAHGPLWSVDPTTGEPTRLCTGGVQYPQHRWLMQANGKPNTPLRYSMWVAFEQLPELSTVPLPMLTQWPNANLQSTLDPATCNRRP